MNISTAPSGDLAGEKCMRPDGGTIVTTRSGKEFFVKDEVPKKDEGNRVLKSILDWAANVREKDAGRV